MDKRSSVPALVGLAVEAVEWLPSGSDAGLVRVRGRWTRPGSREPDLPALGLRRGAEARRFESLPDARFGRDPAVWRATFLVPAALMDPQPDELWLAWASGARAGLPAPARGFEPPPAPAAPEAPEPGGELIDRGVLAERRARRAEAAERAASARAAEALKAVEVLELRSAELERRLEALQSAEPAVVEAEPEPPPGPHPAELALAEAAATVKRLRGELAEQHRRSRRAELLRAADSVALASLREQDVRARRLERELADATAAREQAAEQVAAAARRSAADAADVRRRAAEQLAAVQGELETTSARLTERERELTAIGTELARVRSELAAVRADATTRAADLELRLGELDAALTAERRAHERVAGEREAARGELARAEAARSAEAVARAALDDELDRERVARADLVRTLGDLRGELERARGRDAGAERARERAAAAEKAAAVLRGELTQAREDGAAAEASATELRSALAAAQARIAELERELETSGRETGGLMDRIAQLERAADEDLEQRAREQAAAASEIVPPGPGARRDIAASIDAAAAALRSRHAEPESAVPVASVTAEPEPAIVTEGHPARADVVGSSRPDYQWLRGVLVKLAHDDPRAATRILLGLVPAQRALVRPPLEYDLTIRGAGTYAISIAEDAAAARSVGGPRPRGEAAFHVSADVVTLAELLAGVSKRMGRWLGPVRVHGRKDRADALRAALVAADLDLGAVARAGADLEPDLVFRAFAYAIHPSWTKGHTFTVAQEIAGPRPSRWHIAVRDGAPVAVERRAPAAAPDAVVTMSRAAYGRLLRGEPVPSGERPQIRGDRAAVAQLKAWTDRAQGRAI